MGVLTADRPPDEWPPAQRQPRGHPVHPADQMVQHIRGFFAQHAPRPERDTDLPKVIIDQKEPLALLVEAEDPRQVEILKGQAGRFRYLGEACLMHRAQVRPGDDTDLMTFSQRVDHAPADLSLAAAAGFTGISRNQDFHDAPAPWRAAWSRLAV